MKIRQFSNDNVDNKDSNNYAKHDNVDNTNKVKTFWC